ncbi:MAG: LacI family DNA-binding transcriptional regulator [Oscillospiraceae bacterium]|nr:LacI family DNA-binding transcriptional regulator [Oscillospiraceae bacterium]
MILCDINEVSSRCGLTPEEIIEISDRARQEGLKIPEYNREYQFNAFDRVLLHKIAKLLKKRGESLESQERIRQKIRNLILARESASTVEDVALEANVSIGAVSSTLNNSGINIRVGEATREKIIQAARDLKYNPNRFAAALRTKRSGIIGAIVRNIDDPFLRQVLWRVQEISEKHGYSLLMSHANREAKLAENQLKLMVENFFDGLLVLGDMTDDSEFITALSRCGTPAVMIGGRKTSEITSIMYDDRLGAELAFNYITGLGHHEIAYIGNLQHYSVLTRVEKIKEMQKETHLNNYAICYMQSQNIPEAGDAVRRLFRSEINPTAILCGSDYLAQGVMTEVLRNGKKIPEDISIMGYDDLTDGVFPVPITTIHQPVKKAAELAFEELRVQMTMNSINNYNRREITINPKLVIRESCRPLLKTANQ